METAPSINARFFYTSILGLDDPLSPVPPPTSSPNLNKGPPRLFSEYDNSRLEEAWIRQKKEVFRQKLENVTNDVRQRRGTLYSVLEEPESTAVNGRNDIIEPGSVTASMYSRVNGRNSISNMSRQSVMKDDENEEQERDIDVSILAADVSAPSTTGTPFIRAPSRSKVPITTANPTNNHSTIARPRPKPMDSYMWDSSDSAHSTQLAAEENKVHEVKKAKITVGVSQLHQVSIPDLQLEPIYWAPVNDVADVCRATWFYKDTMMPVDSLIANMLEYGYTELQAWTETWQEELKSAINVGARGEERILWKLWPDYICSEPPNSLKDESSIIDSEIETPEQKRERLAEEAHNAIETRLLETDYNNCASGNIENVHIYARAGVLYADDKDAYILKPNLQPSAYYGRKPLANYISKGHSLGIAVVRGFDKNAWDKFYPPIKSNKAAKAYHGAKTSTDITNQNHMAPKVTDLVLVIHGIGQKMSEKNESWHFTHAMNSFRREINVEIGSETTDQSVMRKDAGGIVLLPVNWRHTLSFEDGGFYSEISDQNQYTLQHITPDTLPAVRNIVSDVMLDVPYYLSHHHDKMKTAVINEANRIYNLWCTNNPGFKTAGRVHMIAHSLGSVMAVDILSQQPTVIPKHYSLPFADHLQFRTTNLFCAGSPAALFLLLKRGSIRPRLGFNKADRDPEADKPEICGQTGEYGCLAVENIYNIINPYDPVSYRLNPTVDTVYADSLKPAYLPSPKTSWFSSSTSSATNKESTTLGGWFGSSQTSTRPSLPSRRSTSKLSPTTPSTATNSHMPLRGILERLPSTVEMETHNFTREEIAEKRMYLLNDNGQIDFLLRYGGGRMEISQYLTMLGAHSSYWLLPDFVKMVVGEIRRVPGRRGVREGMRAEKKRMNVTT